MNAMTYLFLKGRQFFYDRPNSKPLRPLIP